MKWSNFIWTFLVHSFKTFSNKILESVWLKNGIIPYQFFSQNLNFCFFFIFLFFTPQKSSLLSTEAFYKGSFKNLSLDDGTNKCCYDAIKTKEQNFIQSQNLSSDNSPLILSNLPGSDQKIKKKYKKPLSNSFSTLSQKNQQIISCSDQDQIWSALKWHFSSGIRLKELASISIIISAMLKIQQPTRDERRSFPLLLKWYSSYWKLIEPILPIIHLRDSSNQIIDGRRELYESLA